MRRRRRTHLPWSGAAVSGDALKTLRDAGRQPEPFQRSSSDFDVAFMTPVLIYGAQYQRAGERTRASHNLAHAGPPPVMRTLTEFGNWSEYCGLSAGAADSRDAEAGEGFWTTVARGAARTQGVSCLRSSASSLAFRGCGLCGDAEVTPSTRSSSNSASPRAMRSTKVLRPETPARSGRIAGPSSSCCIRKGAEKGDTRLVDRGCSSRSAGLRTVSRA